MKRLDYIFHRFIIKPILTLYLRRDRNASFDKFSIEVQKGVFHPLLFFSSKLMYGFIKTLPLENKTLLDVGCGSGLLSLLAYRQGARVTAIDVDQKAVENTKNNFQKNYGGGHTAHVITSDLFNNLEPQAFDFVIINPPYYFKDVKDAAQQAWYCGSDGAYFERLFAGLHEYTHAGSQVYMILEENCEIDRIRSIGAKHRIVFDLALSKQVKWERSYIFRLTGMHAG